MLRNGLASTKKETTKMISRNDIILVLLVVLLAMGSVLYLKMTHHAGARVVVAVNGEESGSYDLNKDQEIVIEEKGNRNRFVIRQGKVSMEEANCPDKICVNHVAIFREGESIVCLPHKVVITVMKNARKQKQDFDIISK